MMLERICFSVLESSLVASVLYALMMLGEGRLAKYSPRCRSTLWFILSARLLVPLPVGIVYFGDSFAQAKWQLLGRVWLAGMAAFFALHLLAYYRLSRRLSRGERHLSLSHAEQQEIRRVFYEIKSTLKIAAPVQLCISSQAAGPMLLGFLRPKVVFPDCMLPKENLRMIFRHELIHYRRRDSWYRLFLLFTLSVHWFNPFLYLMVDSATEDLESACDRSVIKGRDRHFVEQYAQTLLDTARFLLERQRHRGFGKCLRPQRHQGKGPPLC